ncbi:MAG: hypothetical protein QMD78_06120 [Methanocellales archaeon]|nr:hypothetical protein [Methanocellales archaeon]
MGKTVNVNEYTYTKLASLAGELTMLSGRPISLSMAIFMSVSLWDVLEGIHPGTKKRVIEEFKKMDSKDFVEFDEILDRLFEWIIK